MSGDGFALKPTQEKETSKAVGFQGKPLRKEERHHWRSGPKLIYDFGWE